MAEDIGPLGDIRRHLSEVIDPKTVKVTPPGFATEDGFLRRIGSYRQQIVTQQQSLRSSMAGQIPAEIASMVEIVPENLAKDPIVRRRAERFGHRG